MSLGLGEGGGGMPVWKGEICNCIFFCTFFRFGWPVRTVVERGGVEFTCIWNGIDLLEGWGHFFFRNNFLK